MAELLLCKYQFDFLFRLYLPDLHAHFEREGIHSDILTEWFMTSFCYSSFPRRYGSLDRIWDLLQLLMAVCICRTATVVCRRGSRATLTHAHVKF